jgi:DNA polymerase-3 subunit beta
LSERRLPIMKILCEKKHFEAVVQTAIRAISPKSPLFILNHFLIKAADGEVVITGTDMELTIVCRVPVTVETEGAVVVPARILADIVTQLPDGPITVEQVDMSMEIRTAATRININCIAPEEFPSIAGIGDLKAVAVKQSMLRRMIRNTIIAAAGKEEVRVALTGIHMQVGGSTITMTSTDGRRLARMEETLPEPMEQEVSAIVPHRAMAELVRTLHDGDDPVAVFPGEGQIFFRLDGCLIISRLLSGKFPNYETVMPKGFLATVRVDREPFTRALRRSLVMAQQKDTPSLIKLEVGQDRLILTSNTQDLGNFYEELPAMVEGEPIQIAFNGTYIMDFLSNVTCDEVVFRLKDSTSMGLLKAHDDEKYFYIVMPVRLKEEVPV